MFSVVLNISFPYIVDVLILLHLPVTISTRWVFPKVPAKCSRFRCDPFCSATFVFPRGACSQVPYFHAVRVPKFHENETDKTGTLPVVNTVPGGGTPRSSALGWTELGTGPAKGPVVS